MFERSAYNRKKTYAGIIERYLRGFTVACFIEKCK